MNAARCTILSLASALLLGGPAIVAQEDGGSVFDRPAPTAPGQPPNAGDLELNALQLSGVSTLGGQSMFNFVDARNNRSFWVPLKGTVNGISVVSWDPSTDTVVVDRAGRSRSIALKQAQIAAMPSSASAPAVAPAPVRPAGMPTTVIRTPDGGEIVNPKTPQEIAQAETEARMMVSDLLEISMQERARQKTLREAQQKQGQTGQPQPQPAAPAKH